ncbi:MAG: proline dehydrogenase [Streptomyces sp.]|nr:proline dehydrogenase [Streptomyces sp.]
MRILSMKPGHDGAVACITDGVLDFAFEGEKDSFPRYDTLGPAAFCEALSATSGPPDVICVSGWMKGTDVGCDRPMEAAYFGHGDAAVITRPTRIFGREATYFSSTHERSHLFSAYGMSPFPQGQPCYALVWEGHVGSFYEFDEQAKVTRLADVLEGPGSKYAHLFTIADPTASSAPGQFRMENAGRLMALAAHGRPGPEDEDERRLIDFLLSRRDIVLSTPKDEVAWSKFHNIGVESQEFKDIALKLTERLFGIFLGAITPLVRERRPLVIGGGCGLNCEWNSRWRGSGLFPDVFVPPVTNDSGSAIGTAIDAQAHLTGNGKIQWSVYCGTEFVLDMAQPDQFYSLPLDYETVARLLADGAVLGWVQGRYEGGPRALGNRSLLAAPFTRQMHQRLNTIKQRETYRPIAPVCLREDAGEHFDPAGESPYMLFFQKVRSDRLETVTHVDGSARVQTVTRDQNEPLYLLLSAFKRVTGVGVLANTSLNFKGRGFINRMTDLAEYALERGLDGFVVGQRLFLRRHPESSR